MPLRYVNYKCITKLALMSLGTPNLHSGRSFHDMAGDGDARRTLAWSVRTFHRWRGAADKIDIRLEWHSVERIPPPRPLTSNKRLVTSHEEFGGNSHLTETP